MSLPAKYFKLSKEAKLMLLEALVYLLWVKVMLTVTPFRRVAEKLKKSRLEPKSVFAVAEIRVAENVTWAIETVARHVRLGLVCLPQGIAAKWMLERRGLPTKLYIGVKNGVENKVAAHAWLTAGEMILTGKKEMAGHQVIAVFG
ncbi:MAG: hypothetical protein JWM04_579 [Verrucomicrobiales bacterium]|nr:hypothetical protein [Verrucomicrobiales bacterium]